MMDWKWKISKIEEFTFILSVLDTDFKFYNVLFILFDFFLLILFVFSWKLINFISTSFLFTIKFYITLYLYFKHFVNLYVCILKILHLCFPFLFFFIFYFNLFFIMIFIFSIIADL